jgi:hypothetical protein
MLTTVKDFLVHQRGVLGYSKGARLMLAGLFLIVPGLLLPWLTVQVLVILSGLALMLLGIVVWFTEARELLRH